MFDLPGALAPDEYIVEPAVDARERDRGPQHEQ
jgi:hypothetical protein